MWARETLDRGDVHLVFLGAVAGRCFVRHAHCGSGHFHRIKLGSERLHHHAESIKFTGKQQLADRTLGEIKSARLHVKRSWHRGDVNLLLHRRFNVPKQAMFARLSQRDCHAFASGSTSAADAVNVRLRRCRHIKVHYMRQMFDINATRSNIRCNQEINRCSARLLHDAVAFGL